MKKLMMLAAMLGLVVVALVPAIAQVASEFEQEDVESGAIETNFGVENTGDYASQCTPALQFGQTGNFTNGSSFVQYDSELGDFEPGGIEFAFEPELSTECAGTVQQSSAASGS